MTAFAYFGAALAEIAGCFAFWAWLRLDKSPWWLVPGIASLCLFAYGHSLHSDGARARHHAKIGMVPGAPDPRDLVCWIRDYLAANIEISTGDIQDQFPARGGIIGARRTFGPRLDALLDELQDALVA